MICQRCLFRASRTTPKVVSRLFSCSSLRLLTLPETHTSSPPATSTAAAQPFSTPLSGPQGHSKKSKSASALPTSSCPAGMPLKGLNYMKDRDDPVALPDTDYPPWLWRCLDKPTDADGLEDGDLDELSKSKAQRRKATKQRKKLEERRLRGEHVEELMPKVKLQHQSIDLPTGAVEGLKAREELTKAMRKERRAKIKETNYLSSL